jgi:hypothetical protein
MLATSLVAQLVPANASVRGGIRGTVTATMVMTASPPHDHFEKTDDNAMPDVMNGKLAIPRFTRHNARGARCGVRSRIVPST